MNINKNLLNEDISDECIITSSESDSAQQIALEDSREELENKKQNRNQRKSYANRLFWFLCGYMILVFLILFFCGFSLSGLTLSDTVLVALITTTTANVIGIFAFVIHYLFLTKNS